MSHNHSSDGPIVIDYWNATPTCKFDRCSGKALSRNESVLQLCQGHLNHVFPGPDVIKYALLLDRYGY